MRSPLVFAAVFAVLGVFAACSSARVAAVESVAGSAPRWLAVVDVTVIEVRRGRREPHRTVLVDGGRIAAVGRTVAIPRGALRVDGRGKFLVPGLIDMHVHLFNNASHRPPNEWAFPMFVRSGITGVREMRALPEQLAQIARWRAAVDSGASIAPRILAAGVHVNGASNEEVRRKVREAARSGADFIKVFSETTPSAWRALVDEARRVHIPVDGHVPAGVPLLTATDLRTAEHLMQAYEACSSIEPSAIRARDGLSGEAATLLRDEQERDILEHFDPAACARTAAALAATAQAQVPTLVIDSHDGAGVDLAADPRWSLLRADEKQRWRRALARPQPGETRELLASRREVGCRIVGALQAAGVRILAGTDAPMPLIYPGDSLHDELDLLVSCGLSPAEALRAATADAADQLGLSRVTGTIEVGRQADLVLLDEDPLLDIRHLRRIQAVVLAGRLVSRGPF